MDQSRKKSGDGHMWGIVKWLIVAVVVIVNLYADIKMYANGDIAYPLLDIILVGAGVVIFTNKRLYAHRYAFPSVAGMTAFIIFPLVYTVWIAFTNYSGFLKRPAESIPSSSPKGTSSTRPLLSIL